VIDLSKPDIGKKEIKSVIKVLKSGNLVDGYFQSKSENLIKKILNVRYVALTQSCTSALEAASIIIGLKNNDEVLLPSFTFSSTANAIVMRGAKPVFVDVDKKNLNIDIEDLKKKITKKTKAIFLVHYAGLCTQMEEILKLKKKYNLYVIEDAAHAFLSKYKGKYLGTFGDISTFSFHATKNFVGAQGGALVINNRKLIKLSDIVLDKGTDRKRFIQFKFKKLKTSIKKNKIYTWQSIGSEYRASEISSALVYEQIKRKNLIQNKRKKVWNKYISAFNDLNKNYFSFLDFDNKNIKHSYHLFPLILKNVKTANRIIQFLQERKIFATFHYIPLHLSPFGKKFSIKKLLVTENIYKKIVRIPLHSNLTDREVKYIIKNVKVFFNKINKN
jgi:dTDP-4-amino-4,6-dideoxygalactose transaminase